MYKDGMPWKASTVMEEKVRFVVEYEQDNYSMTELCQRYGVARETGYVWLRRYREKGLAGLVELNRAALHHRNQTPKECWSCGRASKKTPFRDNGASGAND
jgi:transposase-like protein